MSALLPPSAFKAGYVHAVKVTEAPIGVRGLPGSWNGHGGGRHESWFGDFAVGEFTTVTGRNHQPR